MLKGKPIIPASEAILKDFEKNGVPDFCLVATSFQIIPSLFQIRKNENFNFKIIFWDHHILPYLTYLKKNSSWLRLYKWLGLKLLKSGEGFFGIFFAGSIIQLKAWKDLSLKILDFLKKEGEHGFCSLFIE